MVKNGLTMVRVLTDYDKTFTDYGKKWTVYGKSIDRLW